MTKVHDFLKLSGKLKCVLDVGCGSGMSARALLALAHSVVAVDASQAMIHEAGSHPAISYQVAKAEELEFGPGTFDLVTLSQILHWTDAEILFSNIARFLEIGRFVVIYDHFFLWNAQSDDPMAEWFTERYLTRFPSPSRKRHKLDIAGEFEPSGFVFAGYQEHSSARQFSLQELIDHLLTQSNVAAALERGECDLASATSWLSGELGQLLGTGGTYHCTPGGPIYYLRRA